MKNILVILPVSIGGRLTTNSIAEGFYQNNYTVTVFDELLNDGIEKKVLETFDCIVGYNFSGLKIKIDKNLEIPCINYFSDNMRTKTAGEEWEKYIQFLNNDDCFTFYWDKDLTQKENFKNLYYLPHFVSFDIYKDLKIKPEFDVMFAGRLDSDYRLAFFENLLYNLPDLKFAWYAINRHYEDAKRRASRPELIEKVYQGFIDNENDMAIAINKAKIIFNMNSQGVSSLNYRTFQTVACKRILISDFRSDLSLFKNYMPFYTSFDDLVIKIKQFLDDETLYKNVADNCYDIAKHNHNSKECVKYMMSKLI